jgi:hypothetical protein
MCIDFQRIAGQARDDNSSQKILIMSIKYVVVENRLCIAFHNLFSRKQKINIKKKE